MDKLDLDEIIRKNPHLDREALDDLRKYLEEVVPGRKTHYRLAPLGTYPVRIGMPDSHVSHKPNRPRGYPGF